MNIDVLRRAITKSTEIFQVYKEQMLGKMRNLVFFLYCKLVDVNVHSTDKIDVTTR